MPAVASFGLVDLPDWIIISGIAGAFLLVGLIFLHLETRARRWRKCTGIVTRSAIKKVPRTGRYGGTYLIDAPDLEYEYVVDGYSYRSRDWSFSNFYSPTFPASLSPSSIISRYPLGSEVLVSFDPKKPCRSVLQYGIGPGSIFCLSCGACALLIAWLCSR
jgi:hypothetical protein